RVLRGSGATPTAKRRPRVRKPCYGASKVPSREPWPFDYPGPRRGTVMVWCPRSCRRRCGTCANGQSGFPKNLGEPVVAWAEPGWSYRVTNSRPQRRTRPMRSEKNECNRGTAKRRQRSAAERTAGSHSALIVPRKLANGSRPEPGEGSEASDHGIALGK